jgi:hypothetical protein
MKYSNQLSSFNIYTSRMAAVLVEATLARFVWRPRLSIRERTIRWITEESTCPFEIVRMRVHAESIV